MSMEKEIIQSNLMKAIKESGRKTKGYDTIATVKRVEKGTAWVHIPGGVTETPAELSIYAKEGDKVRLRVSGGNAYIIGNLTAPPTDNAEAVIAKAAAKLAESKADTAKNVADKSKEKASNANIRANNAENLASAAGTKAEGAKAKVIETEEKIKLLGIKLESIIRQTSDGIEVGKIPVETSLAIGDDITLPMALVNVDGTFDVKLVKYVNINGNIEIESEEKIASFGRVAVIGKLTGAHALIDNDSFDIIDANGYVRASLGGKTPMLQIGKFTFVNRENGNLTLRLNEEW